MFRDANARTGSLSAFAASLVGGNGLLTDFVMERGGPKGSLRAPRAERADETRSGIDDPPRVGVFRRSLTATNLYEDVASVCRYYGFAGLVPNTVLLDGRALEGQPAVLAQLTALTHELDYNQLIYAASDADDEQTVANRRIDVWWKYGYGNLGLVLALLRFITSSKAHEHATLRFVLVSDDSANNDILRTRVRRTLKEARVAAEIEVVNNALEAKGLVDWVQSESADAALAIVGLADDVNANDEESFARWRELLQSRISVLLVRGSSSFEDEVALAPTVSRSLMPAAAETEQPVLDGLNVEDNPQIEGRVEDFGEAVQHAVLTLHEHGIARLHAPQVGLLRALRAAYERRALELEQRLAGENPRKQRKLLNRLHSTFLMDVRKLIEAAVERDLPAQRDALEGRVEAFLRDDALAAEEADALLWIFADPKRFEVEPGDSRQLRRLKRRRRWVSFFKRGNPSYPTPIGVLMRAARKELVSGLLTESIQRATSDCHQLAAHIAKRLNASDEMLELVRGVEEGEDVQRLLAEHRKNTLQHFDELIAAEKAVIESHRARMIEAARSCVQTFADRLADLGTYGRRRKLRVDETALSQRESELTEAATRWFDNQRALLERALSSLRVSAFQHRLTTIVSRERDALQLEFHSGLAKDLERFHGQLSDFCERLEAGEAKAADAPSFSFDRRPAFEAGLVIERLEKEAEACALELPESITTVDNDSIERLEEQGSRARVESVTLSVRSLVKFAVESELTGVLEEQISRLPPIEQRAVAVGHDVARLVAFQLDQFNQDGEEGGEDFATHMLPAVENGVERLVAELDKVSSALDGVLHAVDEQLEALMEKTSVYELANASDTFDESRRRQRGRKAVTGAYGAILRLVGALRRGSVAVLYRTTAGLVLARRLHRQRATHGRTVERVMAEVTEHSPKSEVLEALPYYYRQLFFGQATLNENFWASRAEEVQAAKTAIGHFQRGAKGCLIVQGERGSGKTALWQHITSRLLDRRELFRVHPVAGGSARLADFEQALREAVGQPGSSRQLVAGLDRGSVIVIDDFELWWERTPTGMVVVDQVLDLIDRFGDRCLFLLCLGQQAYELITRLRPLSDRALGVIECGPVSAETLKDVITLRHESTGLTYELDGRNEEGLSQWAVARLFAAHFHYCRGLIGVAQQSWITHIVRCDKQHLSIERPRVVRAQSFDDLSMEHSALLLQLCLHKQLHEERLNRLRPGAPAANRQLVASLLRMGLLVEPRPHVYEINRFVQHLLVQSLRERGLLV
jgi:hypothetical protein